MRRKHVVWGLVVVALIGGISSQVRAQGFPWWAFDSASLMRSSPVGR